MNKWPKPVDQSSKAGQLISFTQALASLLSDDLVVFDMHDGDEKDLRTDRDEKLNITPYKNDQKWSVDSTFNDQCIASVNFQVPENLTHHQSLSRSGVGHGLHWGCR